MKTEDNVGVAKIGCVLLTGEVVLRHTVNIRRKKKRKKEEKKIN